MLTVIENGDINSEDELVAVLDKIINNNEVYIFETSSGFDIELKPCSEEVNQFEDYRKDKYKLAFDVEDKNLLLTHNSEIIDFVDKIKRKNSTVQ